MHACLKRISLRNIFKNFLWEKESSTFFFFGYLYFFMKMVLNFFFKNLLTIDLNIHIKMTLKKKIKLCLGIILMSAF